LRGSLFFWVLYSRDCVQLMVLLVLGRGRTEVGLCSAPNWQGGG
jgi:hypothetical protein